jgi:hypothetical protein
MFKKDQKDIVEDNHMKFEYFLNFYKSTMMWNKILFQEDKLEMLTERRNVLEAG